MKRYKLLRDLPTFKAGDEFYLSENGELVFNGGNIGEVAYRYRDLEKFPNILKDWFEEAEENGRWRGGKREFIGGSTLAMGALIITLKIGIN